MLTDSEREQKISFIRENLDKLDETDKEIFTKLFDN